MEIAAADEKILVELAYGSSVTPIANSAKCSKCRCISSPGTTTGKGSVLRALISYKLISGDCCRFPSAVAVVVLVRCFLALSNGFEKVISDVRNMITDRLDSDPAITLS